jgi:hypothetical protein
VKLLLLAAATVLAASPALADCRSDAQTQAEKVRVARQELSTQSGAPMADQCRTGLGLIAESKRLNAIYRTCQADLSVSDQELQAFTQRIMAADQEYSARCSG